MKRQFVTIRFGTDLIPNIWYTVILLNPTRAISSMIPSKTGGKPRFYLTYKANFQYLSTDKVFNLVLPSSQFRREYEQLPLPFRQNVGNKIQFTLKKERGRLITKDWKHIV